ncbi:hypothetical protein ES705_11162 [subsurface metagenome]
MTLNLLALKGAELESFTDDGMMKKQNDVLKFIYVGHLIDIPKGFGVLLEAINKVLVENRKLKVFFEFCGIGPLESKLKKLENKYPEYIKYHGYVSNEKMSEIYKKDDVMLFSSRREPFPRVIMEVLTGNLMILSSKIK